MVICFFSPVIPNILTFVFLLAWDWSRKAAGDGGHRQETENTKEEETKRPQRTSETGVGLCLVLQGHTGQH